MSVVTLQHGQPRVAYFYDSEVGSFYYGPGHPMKPQRLRLTHSLVLAYGLYAKMEVYRPHPAQHAELSQFHAVDYVDFLRRVTPENHKDYLHQLQKFNLGPYTDCPVFDGLYDFCSLYTGGSLDGAMKLNHNVSDIAVNWSGGLHHAKKSEASGFCYINDIVLAILELLKYHARVLYIDIDIHHGDGVEEAFYSTDRVMTASFHKFGDFFPGTGSIDDVGVGRGKNYSVNVPLNDGITDNQYIHLFKPIITAVIDVYAPTVIVLQCGADSVSGDRLGVFNVTVKAHGECVRFVKALGLPVLVLGGGGYNIRNVARTWCYETSIVTDVTVSNHIPYNEYAQYYGPEYKLHINAQPDMLNLNTRESLEATKSKILQQLSQLTHRPSVQMSVAPRDAYVLHELMAENRDHMAGDGAGTSNHHNNSNTNAHNVNNSNNGNKRMSIQQTDQQVTHRAELYEDDHDNDNSSNNRTKGRPKQPVSLQTMDTDTDERFGL